MLQQQIRGQKQHWHSVVAAAGSVNSVLPYVLEKYDMSHIELGFWLEMWRACETDVQSLNRMVCLALPMQYVLHLNTLGKT